MATEVKLNDKQHRVMKEAVEAHVASQKRAVNTAKNVLLKEVHEKLLKDALEVQALL